MTTEVDEDAETKALRTLDADTGEAPEDVTGALTRETFARWLEGRATTEPFTTAKAAMRIAATEVREGAVERFARRAGR